MILEYSRLIVFILVFVYRRLRTKLIRKDMNLGFKLLLA